MIKFGLGALTIVKGSRHVSVKWRLVLHASFQFVIHLGGSSSGQLQMVLRFAYFLIGHEVTTKDTMLLKLVLLRMHHFRYELISKDESPRRTDRLVIELQLVPLLSVLDWRQNA